MFSDYKLQQEVTGFAFSTSVENSLDAVTLESSFEYTYWNLLLNIPKYSLKYTSVFFKTCWNIL